MPSDGPVAAGMSVSTPLLSFRFLPPIWLFVLSSLVIFSPLLEGGTTHLAVMMIRLMILFLLSVYLWGGIRAGTLACPRLQVGLALLTYLAMAALSTGFSAYTHQSLQWLIVLFSYAVLLYLIVFFVVEWDHIAKLLIVLVSMGLFEVGWALVEVAWGDALRPSGTFFNPNFLASYLGAIATIVLGYLCYGKIEWSGRRRSSLAMFKSSRFNLLRLFTPIALLASLVTAIVLTGSRGGLLALLVGTGLVLGIRFGRKGLAVLLVPLLVCLIVPNPLRDRLFAEHTDNPVGYARWHMWQSAAQEMIDYPLGIGLGLYQYMYPRYAFPIEGQIARYGKSAQTPHNEYLQMGVELGVLSLSVFMWGVVVIAREGVLVLKGRLKRWQRGVVVGVGAGMAGILAHAAVDSNLHEPAIAIVFTLLVGILLSAGRLSTHVPSRLRTIAIRSRFVWAGVGLATIVVLALFIVKLGVAWITFEAGTKAAARQDYLQAIGHYRTAIALDSNKTLYHSSLAAAHFQVFERTGDGAAALAAVAELESAIRLNPLDGRLSGLLGHVYVSLTSARFSSDAVTASSDEQRRSWLRSALVAYQRAAESDPFNPFYQLEQGRLHLAFGNREMAITCARQGTEIEPNFLPGREFLSRLYLESDRPELAWQEYREILARQQRYAGWNKDDLEKRFLQVDVATLAAVLEKIKMRT